VRRADDQDRDVAKARTEERAWLYTAWHGFDDGIKLVGVSEEASRWQKIGDGEPFVIRFFPDGTVQKAVAIRIESQDLDVKRENRTMTVLLNGLTAESWTEDGDGELPQKRDAREFP
jgi:hypothetical protein